MKTSSEIGNSLATRGEGEWDVAAEQWRGALELIFLRLQVDSFL